MPVDQNKLRRYQIYDRFFSTPHACYSRERIYQELNEILADEGFPVKKVEGNRKYVVSRSTVNHDIAPENGNFMRDMCPKSDIETYITKDGVTCYRYEDKGYSYWNHELNSTELLQLKSILLLLRQFDNLPQYKTIEDLVEHLENKYAFQLGDTSGAIGFETNENVDAAKYLSELFATIIGKQVLRIQYKPYDKPVQEFLVHPYYLRQYNQGWFLYGLLDGSDQFIINLALDRMLSIEKSSIKYIETNIDFSNDYFYDLIGVTNPLDVEAETIVLEFTSNRFPYIQNKPIHGTQRILDEDSHRISIVVKPAKELYQRLLSYGSDVEVISPESIRKKMKVLIKEMSERYK